MCVLWHLTNLLSILKSYLKEVLSEIATLDKKGAYTNCYHLKSEYSRHAATNESIAPVGLVSGNSGVLLMDDDDIALENNDDDDEMVENNDDD